MLACSKEDNDNPDISTTDCTITTQIYNFNNNPSLFVSTQDRAIVLDTMGENISNDILYYEKPIGEVLDLTYINEFDYGITSGVELSTYRNIDNDFFLSTTPCNPYPETTLTSQSIELIITATPDSLEFIGLPLVAEEIVYSPEVNQIRIVGRLFLNFDFQITVRPKNQNTVYTYLFKNTHWVTGVVTDWTQTISFNNFEEGIAYPIELGLESNWRLNSRAKYEDRNLLLTNESPWYSHPMGTEVVLYLSPEIESNMQSIHLHIRSNNIFDGYEYQKTTTFVPEEINFFEPEIDLSDASKNTYKITTDADYDFAKVSYLFIKDDQAFHWHIYQYPNDGLSYQLPNIPEYYLNTNSFLKEGLENPLRIAVKFFKIVDFDPNFTPKQVSNFERQFYCLDFDACTKSRSF